MFWQGRYIFKGPEAKPQVFAIEKGKGIAEIASDLKEAGLIKSKSLFAFLALLQGKHGRLMAGSYELSPQMSVSEVLAKISSGDVAREEITIIEGWGLRDIGRALENGGVCQAEEFFEVTGFPVVDYTANSSRLFSFRDFSEEFSFLKEKPSQVSLEGYLFPDTYQIIKGQKIEDIVANMLSNFEQKLTLDLLQEIANQKRTLFEVLIMASLLEREVKTYKDKQIAAGLLWKRLQAGWPLQVDATLTYLTGKPSSQLTQDDLNFDSLYNTYRYPGLPLGPICNPGLDSIKAAVYYKDSPYWFYLTTPQGETVFSETLAEHGLNKYKYLR